MSQTTNPPPPLIVISVVSFILWVLTPVGTPAAVISVASLLLYVLWMVPKWQVEAVSVESESERFELETEARKTLAEIIGGVVVIAGLYFTWQSLKSTQDSIASARQSAERSLEISMQSLDRATEAQITERFTKAIEQLGSDNINVRLGAIHALERIANDSDKDYWPVIEILTAYVRQTSALADGAGATAAAAPRPDVISLDIQTVLRVLGRRRHSYKNNEEQRLNLVGADLRGAVIEKDVHFEGASFREANLERAQLWNAHLENSILHRTNLQNANLYNAHLSGADLKGANLKGADLSNAQGLTVNQINLADWDESTIFSPEFKRQLTGGGEQEQ
jgi:Pentapeptide repeats (8 copies)